MPSSPPRRRGAPPGNTNALKHGFYSKKIRKADINDVEATHFHGLAEEIAMIRIFIRRTIELGAKVEDFYEAANLLRILCLATTSLTRLIRTQQLISSESNAFKQIVDQALSEVQVELGLKSLSPQVDDSPEARLLRLLQSSSAQPASEGQPPSGSQPSSPSSTTL